MFSAAKYAIDARMNDAASGYFNLIFMPTSVIYMVANFVIRPFLTRLTDLWTGKDYDCFKKELMRIGAIIQMCIRDRPGLRWPEPPPEGRSPVHLHSGRLKNQGRFVRLLWKKPDHN